MQIRRDLKKKKKCKCLEGASLLSFKLKSYHSCLSWLLLGDYDAQNLYLTHSL